MENKNINLKEWVVYNIIYDIIIIFTSQGVYHSLLNFIKRLKDYKIFYSHVPAMSSLMRSLVYLPRPICLVASPRITCTLRQT